MDKYLHHIPPKLVEQNHNIKKFISVFDYARELHIVPELAIYADSYNPLLTPDKLDDAKFKADGSEDFFALRPDLDEERGTFIMRQFVEDFGFPTHKSLRKKQYECLYMNKNNILGMRGTIFGMRTGLSCILGTDPGDISISIYNPPPWLHFTRLSTAILPNGDDLRLEDPYGYFSPGDPPNNSSDPSDSVSFPDDFSPRLIPTLLGPTAYRGAVTDKLIPAVLDEYTEDTFTFNDYHKTITINIPDSSVTNTDFKTPEFKKYLKGVIVFCGLFLNNITNKDIENIKLKFL